MATNTDYNNNNNNNLHTLTGITPSFQLEKQSLKRSASEAGLNNPVVVVANIKFNNNDQSPPSPPLSTYEPSVLHPIQKTGASSLHEVSTHNTIDLEDGSQYVRLDNGDQYINLRTKDNENPTQHFLLQNGSYTEKMWDLVSGSNNKLLAAVEELIQKDQLQLPSTRDKALITNHDANTLLHLACNSDSTELLEYALKQGCDFNISNEDNQTPFEALYTRPAPSGDMINTLLKAMVKSGKVDMDDIQNKVKTWNDACLAEDNDPHEEEFSPRMVLQNVIEFNIENSH